MFTPLTLATIGVLCWFLLVGIGVLIQRHREDKQAHWQHLYEVGIPFCDYGWIARNGTTWRDTTYTLFGTGISGTFDAWALQGLRDTINELLKDAVQSLDIHDEQDDEQGELQQCS